MGHAHGFALVHGETAYFAKSFNVYSYTVTDNKWNELQPCRNRSFGFAIVNNKLTTVGGWDGRDLTNSLLCLYGNQWEEVLPPMPTSRTSAAAATTPTHLVIAGGQTKMIGGDLPAVEVLNTKTLQWSIASSLPQAVGHPLVVQSDGRLYLSKGEDGVVFSCSVEDLLKCFKPTSINSSDGGSVWTRLADIPAQPHFPGLTTLWGCVLAIGGKIFKGNAIGAIHCYDVATNSWTLTGELPRPVVEPVTVVLPSNKMVLVRNKTTLIGSCS